MDFSHANVRDIDIDRRISASRHRPDADSTPIPELDHFSRIIRGRHVHPAAREIVEELLRRVAFRRAAP
jgi:hypothetical protein